MAEDMKGSTFPAQLSPGSGQELGSEQKVLPTAITAQQEQFELMNERGDIGRDMKSANFF
eukprot:CAMPEP_0170498032 /NCGR_PEP_ID=MMETSP0208-20121228/26583_1 /TAXON_ID=197538 /ORGANISM="Strombidium inclinatum, Strain S3" /LENGTH=59 /DNA_ID=CAMNT_0010775069 /DNA_START=258 /DNA_END=437 /DNA_ORIENTATION=+